MKRERHRRKRRRRRNRRLSPRSPHRLLFRLTPHRTTAATGSAITQDGSATDMAFTTAQLQALDNAIASGSLTVSYGGRQVTYQSMEDRKSVVSGKRVSVRVDFGGGRIIKKHKRIQSCDQMNTHQAKT